MKYLLCALILWITPSLVYACDPAYNPDPWFVYEFKVDKAVVPEGLKFEKAATSDGVSDAIMYNGSEPIYFYNPQGGVPTHLVNTPQAERYIFENSELPEAFEPLLKLRDSQLFYYDNGGFDKQKSAGYYVSCEENCSALTLDKLLLSPIPITRKDNRPKDVKVLPDMPFSIPFYYQGREHAITGNIVFHLNENYDANAGETSFQKGVRACEKWSQN